MRPRARALFCAVSTLALAGCVHQPRSDAINVVLISIDSLRADHVHAYGYSRETTPNLDRLARQGALFETVIAESSWTLPTHISMLTGLTSLVHGVEEDTERLNPSRPTLASLLREQGYRTGGIFSAPYLDPIYGFAKGFEKYEGVIGEIAYEDAYQGAYEGERPDADSETPPTGRDINPLSHRTISSPTVTQKAIEFLSEVAGEKFFLFVHYFDVHYDYTPPEELWRKFDPDYQGSLTGRNFSRDPSIHPGMSPRDLEHLVALYDGEILFTDRYIGYLMDALERNGLAEKTLVMVTSDHGEEFFEHGNPGHGRSLYDEVLKVPLIVRLPGRVKPGTRISEQVRQVDITPSILSLVGLTEEPGVGGADLAQVLEGGSAPPRLPAVSRLVTGQGRNVHVSFRTDEYKYILHRMDREKTESELLFFLSRDPGEQRPAVRRQAWGTHAQLEQQLELMKAELDLHLSNELSTRAALADDEEEQKVELPSELRERLRALGYVQ
jgi:arylsulfatase A-like enzyme